MGLSTGWKPEVVKRSAGRRRKTPSGSLPRSYFRKWLVVRSTITIDSGRNLWISVILMAGVDVLLVARMAGTAVAMIERIYGHFRNQSYQETQARLDWERPARGL